MRTALSRVVFQRILQNKPILHQDLVYRRPLQQRWMRSSSRVLLPSVHRRNFFSFVNNAKGADPLATTVPGLPVLIDTSKRLSIKLRTPEPERIAEAWTAVFKSRTANKFPITDFQTSWIQPVFTFLERNGDTATNLRLAKEALTAMGSGTYNLPWKDRPIQLEPTYAHFARRLWEYICENEAEVDSQWTSNLVSALSFAGFPEEAFEVLKENLGTSNSPENWISVIRGFRRRENSQGIKDVVAFLRTNNLLQDPEVKGNIAAALANLGDFSGVDPEPGHLISPELAAEIIRGRTKYGQKPVPEEVILQSMDVPELS
jgi:hypothetical protein